jgi:type IX secretion system PorP/SprF family membrane protein
VIRKLLGILILILAVPSWAQEIPYVPDPMGAQDLPDLSNYQHNWMIYNAAFTGSRDAASISSFLRQKNMSSPGPMYQQLSGHTPLKNNEKIALGVNFFSEQNAGSIFGDNAAPAPFRKSSLFLSYAYRIKAGDGQLSLGISGGITSFYEDLSSLKTVSLGDAYLSAKEREVLPNVGAGVLYYVDTEDQRYFVGLSVPYFLSRGASKNSIAHEFGTYTGVLTGGYRVKLADGFSLYPTGLAMYEVGQQTLKYQASMNFGFAKEKLWLGAIYKSSVKFGNEGILANAIAVNVNVEISKKVLLGYSFDYTLDDKESYFNGSHEIVLRYEFRNTIASKVPFYY